MYSTSEDNKIVYLKPQSLRQPTRLSSELISPAVGDTRVVSVVEHASEPIKSLTDIQRIQDYLISKGRYRDNMLFVVGINFGLRVSDLVQLRFIDLIDTNLVFREGFSILEKKTSNTRKQKKNRYVSINEAVIQAVTLYLENTPDVKLSDYMFRSGSNNGSASDKPLHRNSVERILKGIASDLGLTMKVGTHTLRKTFGYHQMMMGNNDPRRLLLLQKMFGHSTSAQTLDYIGITDEEMREAYCSLNLGLRREHPTKGLVDSVVYEVTTDNPGQVPAV